MSSLYEYDSDRVAGSGEIVEGIAGEAIANKAICCVIDGLYYQADADLAARMPAFALAMFPLTAGQRGRFLMRGFIGLSTWTWTPGSALYVSGTAGQMSHTAGSIRQDVGVAFTATQIFIHPQGLDTEGACALLEGATAYVGFDNCKGATYANYFLADGVADNVTVAAALAYIDGLGGGKLILEDGNYAFAVQIDIDFGDLLIEGYGKDTVITFAQTGFAFSFIPAATIYNLTIQNIKFIGDPADNENQIIITKDLQNITIQNCFFEDVGDEAITLGLASRNGIIKNNFFSNTGAADVAGAAVTLQSGHHLIEGNTIMGGGVGFGIHLEAIVDTEDIEKVRIKNNEIYDTGDDAIFVNASGFDISDVIIEGNELYDAGDEGISFNASVGRIIDNINIVDNHIINSTGVGILNLSAQRIINVKIVGNTISGSGSDGVNTTAEGWEINDNDISGNTGDGVELSTGSSHCTLSDNRIHENLTNGINLTGSSENIINGNEIIDNKADGAGAENGIKLNNNCDDNLITDNVITTTVGSRQEYGIKIVDVASERNRIFDNYMLGNAIGPMSNGSPTTIFDSEPFQFLKELNGAYLTATPTGIEIDANTEGAILQGHINPKAQQVMRIRIFAVALDAPIGAGGQMHLELTFNAGTPNAAYNTAAKSWTLADFDGEEADYVANDVITWVVEDGDVGNELGALAAGDKFELIVTHEAGADPDGATDAVFGSIEVEYV